MEAKRVDGIGEEPGDLIVVSATPSEWLGIIDQLNDGGWELNKESSKMVYWLINQGVYDR